MDLNHDGVKWNHWKATERTLSISKAAKIDDLSQAIVSKLILSEDFPDHKGYPLAVLAVKVGL